jgi:hypothetical protein
MKTTITLTLALAAMLLFAGCSHNISTYSDGIGFETTLRPDSGNFGVILRYGKIWNFVARENTEAEMNGSNEFDAEGNPVASKTAGSVKIKIGTQTTGYERDVIEMLKDNPEAIKAFYESKNKINGKKE